MLFDSTVPNDQEISDPRMAKQASSFDCPAPENRGKSRNADQTQADCQDERQPDLLFFEYEDFEERRPDRDRSTSTDATPEGIVFSAQKSPP